jgi:hypothetical protein
MRAAVYWAPPVHDPLWPLGCHWLGRDAEANTNVPQPPIDTMDNLTRQARHYGFHCTLRPPMRLASTWEAFHHAVLGAAGTARPFALPRLRLRVLDGFLALTLAHPSAGMRSLADLCVSATEPHRAPAPPAELARRRAAGLSPQQEQMLRAWGYPYVMQEWFFHMTLTRRLTPAEMDAVMPKAAAHFAAALDMPRMIEEICIFTQQEGDFLIAERIPLG